MTNFSIFLKSFLFTSLLVLILSHQALAAKKQRNWRIGLGRMINTVYYGYETKNKDSSYAKIEQNSTGQVYNTVLVMEYLFGGRKSPALFGLEFDLGTSTGQRNFTLKSSKTKIGDVLQKLNTNFLYGGNVFFSDGGEEGFNWSVGLMTGTMTVKNEFQNGDVSDDGNDEYSGWGFNNTQESSHTIPVEIVKLGFEWILETAVFRFEYFSTKQTFFGQEDAQIIASDKLAGIDDKAPQTETIKLQGGLGLVVQGRF